MDTEMSKDERLARAIHNVVDSFLIATGHNEFKLHPYYAKDIGDFERALVKVASEKRS